jgi:hypothetical protein
LINKVLLHTSENFICIIYVYAENKKIRIRSNARAFN